MPNLVEQLRNAAVTDLFDSEQFREMWDVRRAFFLEKLGGNPTKSSVRALGNYLSDAFKLSAGPGRSQSSLSHAGYAWEALVVWYLNICLAGTHAVCVKGRRLCPAPIKDALSVRFENFALKDEPDVLLLSLGSLASLPQAPDRMAMRAAVDSVVATQFDAAGVINIQCKTNWNDNAQIPMLWNMLYSQVREGAHSSRYLIGNEYSLRNLRYFGYAFATVPSQGGGPGAYQQGSTAVMRAKTMTAGNYWGYPTVAGVCSSLSDLFGQFSRDAVAFPNVAAIGEKAAQALQPGSGMLSDLAAFRLIGQDLAQSASLFSDQSP